MYVNVVKNSTWLKFISGPSGINPEKSVQSLFMKWYHNSLDNKMRLLISQYLAYIAF